MFRFEQECSGWFDPLPRPLPMVAPSQTFPLLTIDGSQWLEQSSMIYKQARSRADDAFMRFVFPRNP